MITQEQNDRLTRVGPGTPMGNLLRRYWHPVGATSELEKEPVQPVRLNSPMIQLPRERIGYQQFWTIDGVLREAARPAFRG